jgi:diacylglycerol kinase
VTSKKLFISKRLKSFKYAFNGLRILIKEEHNSRIHLAVAICVIMVGFYFDISATEWLSLILAIGFVITMEIVNSSIENICDFISPKKHELIKKVKDLGAAAVLVSAFTAIFVGLIVFIPKIYLLLTQ